jgi:ParB family chromosome partitioning protein
MSSKVDKMRAAAARAAAAAPSIEDRIAHAREMANSNPLTVTETQRTTSSPDHQAPGPHLDMTLNLAGTVENTQNGLQYRVVALDEIEPNPFNARKVYRPERVSALAASIGAHGQETPGLATIRNGKVVLAAGHYRFRALKISNIKTMMLMIREGLSDKELYEISYRENAEREDQSALDNALAWRALLDDGVYANETDIAEATGLSLPTVNKTLAALKLSREVMDAVKDEPSAFGISILYEIVLFEQAVTATEMLGKERGISETLTIVKAVKAGEMSRVAVQAAREKFAQPTRPRKQKETSRQYKIQNAGIAVGQLKEWDSGKVVLELVYSNPEERAAIVEELKTRFGLNRG